MRAHGLISFGVMSESAVQAQNEEKDQKGFNIRAKCDQLVVAYLADQPEDVQMGLVKIKNWT